MTSGPPDDTPSPGREIYFNESERRVGKELNKNYLLWCIYACSKKVFSLFRYRQHCKPGSVPNVSSFYWAFPLLTSRKSAHKTFQFTSCQPRNESILHKGHKGLAWFLNAFIGGLSESYDSLLKLPLKCLKNGWIETYLFENLCLLRRRAFLCDVPPILEMIM